MRVSVSIAIAAGALVFAGGASAHGHHHAKAAHGGDRAPIVIGHRGSAAYRPEHTLGSYQLAIHMGADSIDPDRASTKDPQRVVGHEPNIMDTTDVSQHPEFANRKTTKTIDGVPQ